MLAVAILVLEDIVVLSRGDQVPADALVLEGAAPPPVTELSLEDALLLVEEKLSQGLSRKDAVKQVSKETGFAKNALYDAAVKG